MPILPTSDESARRDCVMERVFEDIRQGRRIVLPDFEPGAEEGGEEYALFAIQPNDYSGEVCGYRYQFEGEDDLLHVMVLRLDRQPLTVQDAQQVVAFLLPDTPPGLVWLKPGTLSQHFYVGHDELLR
jgi:hypothetical protein